MALRRLITTLALCATLSCSARALRLTGTVQEPGQFTSLSQLSTPILGGRAGMFWGAVNSSLVEEVCEALLTEGLDMVIETELEAYGAVKERSIQLIAITGCTHPSYASPVSPTGVQAIIANVETGKEYAVVCGEWNNNTGLDYTTAVEYCSIYSTGDDIEELMEEALAAMENNTTAPGRRLQNKNDISSNNTPVCPACVSNCTCVQVNPVTVVNCFPAKATAFVLGQGPVRMDSLRVGQQVLAVDASGKQSFQEVVFFGHRDPSRVGQVVALEVRAAGAAGATATRTLRLSARHFVPTMTAAGLWHKYAGDVVLGEMLLLAEPGSEPLVGEVVGKRQELAAGLYNPYTKNGYIVMDGVLASAHSDFILDDLTPPSLRHMLPAVYQAAFAPITLAYTILGPATVERLTDSIAPLVTANLRTLGLSLAVAATLSVATVSRAAHRRVTKHASKQL